MDQSTLQAWYAHRQGLLGGMENLSNRQVLEFTGWSRCVGGAGPYIGLFARNRSSREQVDKDVAAHEISELPSARACTYVLPKDDFALGLSCGLTFRNSGEMRVAKTLGVTDEEITNLATKILEALEKGPNDPKGLKDIVGDAARNLGPEGKKKGLTTTMPMVLGLLQAEGKIIRKPLNGRLDSQRYAYARWDENIVLTSPDEAYNKLAERFFRWIGPASLAEFAEFAGISKKAATAATANLGLKPTDEDDRLLPLDVLVQFQEFKAPTEPVYRLICSMDNLLLHRWNIRTFLNESDLKETVWSEGKAIEVGGLQELYHHAIIASGRIIGFWEFDSEVGEIVRHLFVPTNSELEAEIERTAQFARDQLGDVRSFSLDSPESRKPKLAALRAAR